ncbi:hypothetical protein, partial [Fulvivirga aurantia]|uniref:hypothetical protein n=1 Tax=Fulvivirga aurantia TaxID=2529383 RepID=UPI00162657B3
VATMEMNFSNFKEDNSGGRIEESNNWAVAATTVGVWNTILAVNLAIPVSAFKAAISQKPSYDSDRALWVWRFDYDVVGRTYSSELTAGFVNDGVEWNMYISQQNGFQDVLWYSGVMNTGGTEGYWMLNIDGDSPRDFLRIDWEKENEEIGKIKYTSIDATADLNGSYIEYSKSADVEFNRSYDIYIDKDDNLVEIDWNSNDGNGRIKNSDFYGDDLFHCWDTNFENIDC